MLNDLRYQNAVVVQGRTIHAVSETDAHVVTSRAYCRYIWAFSASHLGLLGRPRRHGWARVEVLIGARPWAGPGVDLRGGRPRIQTSNVFRQSKRRFFVIFCAPAVCGLKGHCKTYCDEKTVPRRGSRAPGASDSKNEVVGGLGPRGKSWGAARTTTLLRLLLLLPFQQQQQHQQQHPYQSLPEISQYTVVAHAVCLRESLPPFPRQLSLANRF